MIKKIALSIIALSLVACSGNQIKEVSYSKPQDVNVVLIAQDSGMDDLDISSTTFRHIEKNVAKEILQRTYTLFDVSDVTGNSFSGERDRFTQEDLMAYFADRPKPRMDALVPLRVSYVLDRDNDRLSVSLKAKVLDVNSQKLIAMIEVPGPYTKLPKNCRGMCVQKQIPELAAPLVKDLGKSLAYRLSQFIHTSYRMHEEASSEDGHQNKPAPGARVEGVLIESNARPSATVIESVPVTKPTPAPKNKTKSTTKRVGGVLVESKSSDSNKQKKIVW